jgi:hypothetical protein
MWTRKHALRKSFAMSSKNLFRSDREFRITTASQPHRHSRAGERSGHENRAHAWNIGLALCARDQAPQSAGSEGTARQNRYRMVPFVHWSLDVTHGGPKEVEDVE